MYRFSAPLIFSNADAFKATGETLLIEAAAKEPLPHTLVLDFEEVVLKSTARCARAITGLFEYAQRYGVDLSLARVHSGTHKILRLSGVTAEIGEPRVDDTVRNAVAAAGKTSPSGTVSPP